MALPIPSTPQTSPRERYLRLAKLAARAERYQDTISMMESLLVVTPAEPTTEECRLLSMAFKNVVGEKRTSWRIVFGIEKEREGCPEDELFGLAQDYRARVEKELSAVCNRVLRLVEMRLLPSAASPMARVFFLKMKGDYYRYLAEFKQEPARRDAIANSMRAYSDAQNIAAAELPAAHPYTLGLALNFSVFYSDILDSMEAACTMASQAIQEAVAKLDTLSEDLFKESMPILQTLRENVTLWASEAQEKARHNHQ